MIYNVVFQVYSEMIQFYIYSFSNSFPFIGYYSNKLLNIVVWTSHSLTPRIWFWGPQPGPTVCLTSDLPRWAPVSSMVK